jgi:predicted nucleic acid-binding protein
VTYCVDTSSLLECWSRRYPPDVFGRLWDNLDGLITAKELVAPEEVLHELERKEDELYEWARERRDGFFLPLDGQVQSATGEVLAAFPRLVGTLKDRNRADAFVVAVAKVSGLTVVTEERRNSTPERPRIPLICDHFDMRCIDALGLIREQRWTF